MLTIERPQLTPEQLSIIPEYRRKQQKIAINSNPIDREQARIAIHNAYSFLNLPQPNVVFFSDPKEAIKNINREIDNSWGKLERSTLGDPLAIKLISELIGNLNNQIKGEIFEHLQGNLDRGLADNIAREAIDYFGWNSIFTLVWINGRSFMLSSESNSQTDEMIKNFAKIFLNTGFIFNRYVFPPLWSIQKNTLDFIFRNLTQHNLDDSLNRGYQIVFTGEFPRNSHDKYEFPAYQISSVASNVIVPSIITDYAYYINYLNEVLNCSLDLNKWKVFYDLITTCGWIFPYQKTALVCDRYKNPQTFLEIWLRNYRIKKELQEVEEQ